MVHAHRHLLVILLLFLFSSASSAQVYSPTVLRKGQVDTSNLTALARSIYAEAGARTEREKAEAIWHFFLTDGRFVKPGFWYHIAGWAYEEPLGEVLDPLKLLNSYGFGLCYHIAPLLEAVFEAGGFPDARVWFLTGHTVAEVYHDGAYHYYDSDMMGYTTVGNGNFRRLPVASVHEIERDGNIILGKLKSPTEVNTSLVDYPWYPADLREAAMGGLTELFTTSSDNWLFPYTRYSQGHTIDFVLRPGERLVRYFEPEHDGLFYLPYKFDGKHWLEFPTESARWRIRTEDGPKSQKDGRRWATGCLEYRPVLSDKTSPAVFEVSSPYVIIDAEFSMSVSLATGAYSLLAETSTDNGKTWDKAGSLKGPHKGRWQAGPMVKARSEHGTYMAVSGSYGYLVRLSVVGPGPARPIPVEDITITTRFQLNPRTLPELRAGSNELVYRPGAPERRRIIPVKLDQVEQYAWKAVNARYVAERGQGYLLPKEGERADFVFELSSADGSPLSGFDAGGRLLDIRDGLAPDKLTAELRETCVRSSSSSRSPSASLAWSTSPTGEYKILWRYEDKPQWRDGVVIDRLLRWPEVDRQVRSLPPGTRKVYVRYAIDGMAVDDFRLAVITPGASNASHLEVTHVWREDGRQKRHVERINNPGQEHAYVIETGPATAVVNEAVILSCEHASR